MLGLLGFGHAGKLNLLKGEYLILFILSGPGRNIGETGLSGLKMAEMTRSTCFPNEIYIRLVRPTAKNENKHS